MRIASHAPSRSAGLRAWVVCLGCGLALFTVMGLGVNAFTVYQPYLLRVHGFTNAQGSWITTTRSLFTLAAMLTVNQLCARIGQRLVMTLGVELLALSCFSFGLADSFPLYCAAGALTGLAYGYGGMVPLSLAVGHWFRDRRGLALGLAAAGSGVSTIFVPTLITGFIQAHGMRAAFLLEGLAVLVLGLLVSVGAGFWAGRRALRALSRLSWSDRLFRRAQIPGAALTAFLHGAQDGQKFLGVFLLGAALAQGGGVGQTFSVPGWLMLLCAAVMALGTAMGGRRIIETVGRDMVILAPREGLAADLGGGLCLLLCTLAGLPVSTTHAKTAAILGAGSAGGGTVNHRVAARIALTWLFTFPGCGLLGFLLASLFRSPLSCGILMPGTIF